LTFDDAQNIIDGEDDKRFSEAVNYDVRMLFGIANCLHHARYTKEAVSLNTQKLVFDNPNKPNVVSIVNTRPGIVRIVKEFEFLANKCVAQKISAQYTEQAFLRRQGPPDRRKIVS
jgi:protein SSD1